MPHTLALIALLPLVGFLFNGFFATALGGHRTNERAAGLIGSAFPLAAFALEARVAQGRQGALQEGGSVHGLAGTMCNQSSIRIFFGSQSIAGISMFSFLSVSSMILATQRFRYHLRSAGTTYHGASSVEVLPITSS